MTKVDPKAYLKELEACLKASAPVYCAAAARKMHWIDLGIFATKVITPITWRERFEVALPVGVFDREYIARFSFRSSNKARVLFHED
jgi:hypothetical protein